MTTPILDIEEVASGQVNQYLIYNTALRVLEASQNDVHEVDLSSADGSVTLAELQQHYMIVGSGHTVPRTLTFQAQKRQFTVRNAGSAAVSVTVGATSVSVAAGEVFFFYCDGTANSLVAIGGGGGAPEWGDIGGDIADQSDLADALDEKANTDDLSGVATSGLSADVSVADAGGYFVGSNVETVLQEVGVMIGDISSALDEINGEII